MIKLYLQLNKNSYGDTAYYVVDYDYHPLVGRLVRFRKDGKLMDDGDFNYVDAFSNEIEYREVKLKDFPKKYHKGLTNLEYMQLKGNENAENISTSRKRKKV